MFKIGDDVFVIPGATNFMKKNGFWCDSFPDSIDGEAGVVVGDYSHLPAESRHFAVKFSTVRFGALDRIEVGIPPQFIEKTYELRLQEALKNLADRCKLELADPEDVDELNQAIALLEKGC